MSDQTPDYLIQAAKEREARRRRIRDEATRRTQALSDSQRRRLEREFQAAASEARRLNRGGRTAY